MFLQYSFKSIIVPTSSSSGFRDSSSSSGSSSSGITGNTGGTEKPVATGNDEILPSDCGRDPKKGNGLLCFPDGKLCSESKNVDSNRINVQFK